MNYKHIVHYMNRTEQRELHSCAEYSACFYNNSRATRTSLIALVACAPNSDSS